MTPISLAMTVYNRETYLALALDSICNQTYPHWQLTIWDDGSSDASPAIARAYAEKDDRIHFIPAPHTGRACALKAAVAAGKYPYLGWVDSDDLLAPNALAATVAILDRHPNIGMVYTDYADLGVGQVIRTRGAMRSSLFPRTIARRFHDLQLPIDAPQCLRSRRRHRPRFSPGTGLRSVFENVRSRAILPLAAIPLLLSSSRPVDFPRLQPQTNRTIGCRR
jgi:glycosyltransferase involved in cell wall biosynthesis